MPPRPFPFPIGIGTDIVQVSRIYKLIDKTPSRWRDRSQHFINRFLTHREQREFRARFNFEDLTWQSPDEQEAKYLAGRWAAKEAVIKAVHPRRLRLMEVEILRYPALNQQKGVFALIRDTPGSPTPPDRHLPDRDPEVKVLDHEIERDNTESKSSSTDASTQESDSANVAAKAVEEVLAYEELEGQIAKVSISHDGEYATAVCLAVNEPMVGDVGGEAAARMP